MGWYQPSDTAVLSLTPPGRQNRSGASPFLMAVVSVWVSWSPESMVYSTLISGWRSMNSWLNTLRRSCVLSLESMMRRVMVSPPALSPVDACPLPDALLLAVPQAARLNAMAAARPRLTNFFMVWFLLFGSENQLFSALLSSLQRRQCRLRSISAGR